LATAALLGGLLPAHTVAASPPVIVADATSITVDEYTVAHLEGSWSDTDGDEVVVSASVGTATTHGDGRWSWASPTADGPGQVLVTFTATDATAATDTVDVTVNIQNVPPSASTRGPAFVPVSATATRCFTWRVSDVNGDDPQATAGCGSGSVVATGDADGSSVYMLCRFTTAGSTLVGAQATDKDGASTDGRIPVVATTAVRSVSDGRIVIDGDDPFDYIGGALAAVDLDDDGKADVALGSVESLVPPEADDGVVHVLRGRSDSVALNLGTLPNGASWTISGPEGVFFGSRLDSAGDVNGDGVDDLLIGAVGTDAWIVFGKAGFTSLDIEAMPSSRGFRISGVSAYETSAASLRGVGDVNADGYDDIAIGSPNASTGDGEAAVILGRASPTDVDATAIPPGRGFTIHALGDRTGYAVAGGDVNGDGRSDVVVASEGGWGSSALVVFGSEAPANVDEATMTSAQGFTIGGSGALRINDVAVGDLDRDGFADVALSHRISNTSGSLVSIVRGGVSNPTVSMLPATGSRFGRVDTTSAGQAHRIVIQDTNDDGYADLFIGTAFAESNDGNAGSAYIVRGAPTVPNVDLATLDSRWSRIDGDIGYSLAGMGLATGDVTGDGNPDLVVGAPGATNWPGRSQGRVAVFAGTASGDVTAPTVTAPVATLLGSGAVHPLVPVRITWTGKDAATGIGRYEVQRQVDTGAWLPTGGVPTATGATHGLATGHDYRYRVRAVDGAGNWSAWRYGPTFKLKGFSEGHGKIVYGGKWSLSSSTVWWAGAARYATSNGASASLTFTGREVLWVGATGLTRGVARIYVNGTLVKSVDFGSQIENRAVIVFRKVWSTDATRTIRIVVRGTSGRPRIDLDGFVVMR
jgi:hypothetical protein